MMRRALFAFLLVSLLGCDDGPGPGEDAGVDAGPEVDAGPAEDLFRADCEALVPEYCGLPFPSDYWLVVDASTASGNRIEVGPTTLPRSLMRERAHADPTPFNTRDGWSVNASILAFLPSATADGLATPDSIGSSLDPSSPTVLMNAETGERVPHFAELDESSACSMPPCSMPGPPQTFIIRPVVPLEHETRYVVAVRSVVDASGAEIAPSATFLALRSGAASEVATIEARRAHFEELFTILGDNGVLRDDLQLAWDFTTSSQIDDTGWMVSARDQALADVGADGPDFRIETDPSGAEMIVDFTVAENAHIKRRVHILMTVPLFVDSPVAPARLNLGSDGMPTIGGTAEYGMVVNIPRSATPDTPARPLQLAHGLLGSRMQANADWLAEFGDANGLIPFGVDWIGMAEEDFAVITLALGQLGDFAAIPERLVQGVINALLAMRLMLTGLGAHPAFQEGGRSLIDTSAGFFEGHGQGGSLGGTYMALSTDTERGILGVAGQPNNLLLDRSVNFDPYRAFLRVAYRDGPDIQLAIALLQLLWDRAEAGSFTRHIANDPLPGTMLHQVILRTAVGDHQTTPLGAHIMARSIGAVAISPQTRSIWDIGEVMGPHLGSAIVEHDYGLAPAPIVNIPNRSGEDPGPLVRTNPRALEQTAHFFETGEVIQTCVGPCDPE